MSQRKIMKTVIALEKNHVFHRENIAYQKKKRPYLKEHRAFIACIAHDGPFETKYAGEPRVGFRPTN